MKNLYIYAACVAFCILICSSSSLYGKKKQKQVRKPVTVEVVDERGAVLGYSSVSSSRNRYTYTADMAGQVRLEVLPADILKISAEGYKDKILAAADIRDGFIRVSLDECDVRSGNGHLLVTLTGDYMPENRVTGAYSKVDGSELEENPTMFLMDALGGRLNGLFLMNSTLVPGFTTYSGFVRAPNGCAPVILIDGVERSLDYIEPETIESVQLLKDATLKSLYGGVQSNGILMIKTRRGRAYENNVRVNVQSGVEIPTRLPQYLNSAEYASRYNEALVNVGLKPVYDPSKYDGSDPVMYPDVDFYDEFLNKFMSITRANAQLSGGNRNTQYFLNLGFQTNGGLEKYTEYPNRDQVITVRGNIDNTIFDFITFKVGLNAAIQKKTWPNTSTQNFFNALSDTRPNEYPVMIPGHLVGSDEEYVLGGTGIRRDNPLGMLTRNGYVDREYSFLQSDFIIDFNFDKWVKGLSIRPGVTFDIYNEYSARKDGGYSVYEPLGRSESGLSYRTWGHDNPTTSQVRGGVGTRRNWVFSTTAIYDRTFDRHKVYALLTYNMQQQDYFDTIHSKKRMNVGAMVNYMYDNRYVVDASVNYVGVASFSRKNRFGLFPSVGAGWIISENGFMEDVSWIDYLKLRASYGILGSTLYTDKGIVSNYYYRDEWGTGSSYQFSSFNNIVTFNQTGNPDIGFQKSHEVNAGVDFEFFDRSLRGAVGYFRNCLDGGIANLTDITPGIVGKGGALVWDNYKQYVSQGAEAELYYDKRFGDFRMCIGGNFSYGYSEIVREVDVDWPDGLVALAKIRRYGDIKGYTVAGVFKDRADIDNSPAQTFGNVYPGDLKYEDRYADGVIDERDRSVIANVQPTMQYGITLKFRYKGFNLDVLGYGLAGFDRMLTTKYYQNYGARKYSEVLNDGLPNGNPHPVLRADSSENNFVNSGWWVVKGDYFKLRNAEFGYTLPHKVTKKFGLNMLKVFVRGTNLFTISKIKDLDPESLDAGVGNFPLCTTLTAGLSFSF